MGGHEPESEFPTEKGLPGHRSMWAGGDGCCVRRGQGREGSRGRRVRPHPQALLSPLRELGRGGRCPGGGGRRSGRRQGNQLGGEEATGIPQKEGSAVWGQPCQLREMPENRKQLAGYPAGWRVGEHMGT